MKNVVQPDTSAQGLERNLLTPDQIASQDYGRNRAKIVPRGSTSHTVAPRFKPLFSLDENVADSEPYKELAVRHSDLAHSLKTGLNHNTLRFPKVGTNVTPPGPQVNPQRLPALQPRRPSKTSKLENVLLSHPNRVKVVRQIIDRKSGKPLFKSAKLKIVCITDHTYVTDNGKVYRKNYICLKPKSRYNISVGQNSLGDRLQASNPTTHGAVKMPATRVQPVVLEQRPDNKIYLPRWWSLRWTHRVRVRLGQMAAYRWCRTLLPWRNDKSLSTTHLRLRLLICINPHLSIKFRKVLPYRHLRSLPLNFLAHQLRLICRPRIVPPLRLLPIFLKNFLASALPIRGSLFLRRKLQFQRSLFIPLIPRPQSRTHLIRCYLSPLNQWLTTQRQSGLHSAVRNQLSFLANP